MVMSSVRFPLQVLLMVMAFASITGAQTARPVENRLSSTIAAKALNADGSLAAISEGLSISVWNTANGALVRRSSVNRYVSSLAFGKKQELWFGTNAGTLFRWDILERTATAAWKSADRSAAENREITSVATCRASDVVAFATKNGRVWLFSATTSSVDELEGTPQAGLRTTGRDRVADEDNAITTLIFNSQCDYVAAANAGTRSIQLWQVSSRQRVVEFRVPPAPSTRLSTLDGGIIRPGEDDSFAEEPERLFQIGFADRGRVFLVAETLDASVATLSVHSWDTRSGSQNKVLTTTVANPRALVVSEDGWIGAATEAGLIRRWTSTNLAPLEPIAREPVTIPTPPALAGTFDAMVARIGYTPRLFGPIVTSLTVCGPSLMTIEHNVEPDDLSETLSIWNLVDRTYSLRTKLRPLGNIQPIFSPDGRWLIFNERDIVALDLKGGGARFVSPRSSSANPLLPYGAKLLSISPDSRRIAFLNPAIGKGIRVSDLETGNSVQSDPIAIAGRDVSGGDVVAVNPTWTAIATVAGGAARNCIKVLSKNSLTQRCDIPKDLQVASLAFSRGGRWLILRFEEAALSSFATTSLLDMSNREPTRTIEAAAVVISQDDSKAAILEGKINTAGDSWIPSTRVHGLLNSTTSEVIQAWPLAFSKDGNNLFAKRGQIGDIVQVSLVSANMTPMGARCSDVCAFSPDAKLVSTGGLDESRLIVIKEDGSSEPFTLRILERTQASSDAGDDADFLVVSNKTGIFDGTARAMQTISWRFADAPSMVPVDVLYADFFSPGLLANIGAGKIPSPPSEFATRLRVPAITAYLSSGYATIRTEGAQAILCLPAAVRPKGVPLPSYALGDRVGGMDFDKLEYVGSVTNCEWQYPLTNDEVAAAKALLASKGPEPPETPWKGKRDTTTQGVLHVLTVGIDAYSHPEFKPLSKSAAAAWRISSVFRVIENQNGGVKVWDPLIDQAATKGAVIRRLAQMSLEIEADDTLLLFMSGHGTVPAGEEMYYFVPADLHESGLNNLRSGGLSTAEISDAIRHIKARRILIVIDSCQSGGAVNVLDRVVQTKIQQAMLVASPTEYSQAAGALFLAAATPLQIATDNGGGSLNALPNLLIDTVEKALHAGVPLHVSDIASAIDQRWLSETKTETRPVIEQVGIDFRLLPVSKQTKILNPRIETGTLPKARNAIQAIEASRGPADEQLVEPLIDMAEVFANQPIADPEPYWLRAISLVEKNPKRNRILVRLLTLLGQEHMKRGQFKIAAAEFERAVKVSPTEAFTDTFMVEDTVALYELLGAAYEQQVQWGKAEFARRHSYELVVRNKPGEPEQILRTGYQLARTLVAQGKVQDLDMLLSQLIPIISSVMTDTSVAMLSELPNFAHQVGADETAIRVLDAMIDQRKNQRDARPSLAFLHSEYALILQGLGREAEAEQHRRLARALNNRK